jgi:hypothetical protein
MNNDPIAGSWNLVSMVARSTRGDEFLPYGPDPAGLLVYTAGGDVTVTLMRTGRPKFASGDPLSGTPEEVRAAFAGFDAYAGTYRIDAGQAAVAHHIELSRFPNWEGTTQIRYFQLEGERLLLRTPPIAALGQEWILDVVWQRRA